MQVGKVIRAYRQKEDIGVREMAKILGVSAATVSRVERGFAPDGHTMAKLLVWLFS